MKWSAKGQAILQEENSAERTSRMVKKRTARQHPIVHQVMMSLAVKQSGKSLHASALEFLLVLWPLREISTCSRLWASRTFCRCGLVSPWFVESRLAARAFSSSDIGMRTLGSIWTNRGALTLALRFDWDTPVIWFRQVLNMQEACVQSRWAF